MSLREGHLQAYLGAQGPDTEKVGVRLALIPSPLLRVRLHATSHPKDQEQRFPLPAITNTSHNSPNSLCE